METIAIIHFQIFGSCALTVTLVQKPLESVKLVKNHAYVHLAKRMPFPIEARQLSVKYAGGKVT